MEEGIAKLSDGGFIPRGRGSAAMRVEEYWQKKTRSQNMYSSVDSFYHGEEDDDSLRDEIRTLRVRLNQVEGAQAAQVVQPTYAARVQPAYMAQSATSARDVESEAAPPTSSFNDFAKAMYSLMHDEKFRDQFVTTRGGKDSGSSAPGF